MIVIKNLCKKFNDMHVVNSASLTVKKNKVAVIIGPSGSGKSTFLRCINHMEEPDSGIIEIDGNLITRNNISKARKNIGMVFQSFNLFPHMRVIDNIIYAPMKVLGLSRTKSVKQAKELLKKVHMQKYEQAYPANLSGGQKQRVAIVRALAMQPKVMLFDEPTSSLDPEMVKEVLMVIKSLVHTGITIIIVTHLMSFAKEVADEVVFFANGQVVESAPPKKFFSHPKTARAKEFLKKVCDIAN
ncbi:MAG: amino acid ABC transporter ATP-binding protein [Rickettsiales bacterium]|nr:amino acid ABC transporter ATP-binding protein [Rickettsiales bacterium]